MSAERISELLHMFNEMAPIARTFGMALSYTDEGHAVDGGAGERGDPPSTAGLRGRDGGLQRGAERAVGGGPEEEHGGARGAGAAAVDARLSAVLNAVAAIRREAAAGAAHAARAVARHETLDA